MKKSIDLKLSEKVWFYLYVTLNKWPSIVSIINNTLSFSLEKVLEAITTAGEWRTIERFSPIVQGLRERSVQLQVRTDHTWLLSDHLDVEYEMCVEVKDKLQMFRDLFLIQTIICLITTL